MPTGVVFSFHFSICAPEFEFCCNVQNRAQSQYSKFKSCCTLQNEAQSQYSEFKSCCNEAQPQNSELKSCCTVQNEAQSQYVEFKSSVALCRMKRSLSTVNPIPAALCRMKRSPSTARCCSRARISCQWARQMREIQTGRYENSHRSWCRRSRR